MTGDNEKTQPQELLEEVIGITHGDTPEFPTLEEQQEYWRQKDLEENRAEVDPDGFKCLTCDRTFKSAQAVRMHVARVHTKTILAPKEYNPHEHLRDLKEGRPVETLDTHRKKWSLARRRRYNAKKKLEQEAAMSPKVQERTESWERITPQQPEEALIRFCPCCGKNIERFLA